MTGALRRPLLVAALIALVSMLQAMTAVGGGELAVDIASLDADQSGDVVAVVSVADASGRPVAGLTQENFAARTEDTSGGQAGSSIPVSQVTAAVNSDIGIGVVLAVDVSGSMAGDPLVQAQAAARSFVEGLAPIDSVALVTFSDDATPVLNFTIDKGAVIAALDSLQAVGNTALYQATSVSAFVAASAETQRKAVILLSDGLDFGNRSAVNRDDSLAHASTVGVPFFTIGLGSEIDRAYLEALAQGTGGRFLETPTPQGLSDLYQSIGEFLRSQYVVTLSPGSLDRTQPLALEIEVRLGEASGQASETLPALEAPAAATGPPVVKVQGLASGAEIDAPVDLSIEVTGETPLKTLRVSVGDSLLAELTSPPYQVRLDPTAYAAGSHTLRVEAVDTAGSVGTTELAFVAAAPSGGGPSSALLSAGVILLLLAVAGAVGLLMIVRRRPYAPVLATRAQSWSPRSNGDSELWDQSTGELPLLTDEPLGRLVVAAGPQQGATLEVGTRPRRIGSAPHCDLVLTDDDGVVGPEEARVWVSEGRLMYHKLTRLTTFATEGPTGGWFILQDRDEIRIGSHRLVFELLASRSITEAIDKLEQAEQEEASSRKDEQAASRVSRRKRKGVQMPAPAPEAEEPEDDPIARQAAAWLKKESERMPEPVSAPEEATPGADGSRVTETESDATSNPSAGKDTDS
jgi:VWFA-related protein